MTAALLALSVLISAPDAGTPGLEVEVQPGRARPGDAVLVVVRNAEACPEGRLGDRPLTFFEWKGACRALSGLPVEQQPGEVPIVLSTDPDDPEGAQAESAGTLEVIAPNFNVRELTVAKKFVQPPAKVRKRMARDRKAFARAFAQKWAPPKFSENFGWPRQDAITAPFGDLRTFNGKKQSQHYGTDIDGRIGDPVVASNDGVVVMVRDNYAAGQTVVLHHGADIFTTYFHLSRMDVKPGQRVKKGQLLGAVGKSGRVTGPHLHFGVKVGGMYVDAESLLKLDLLK